MAQISRATILPGTKAGVLTVIRGTALTASDGLLPDADVRLRNARTGSITGNTRTDSAGFFSFRAIDPGSYVVELPDSKGKVIAASQIVSVDAGDTATVVVKLPYHARPLAAILWPKGPAATIVTAAAASAGVLALEVSGSDVTPRK